MNKFLTIIRACFKKKNLILNKVLSFILVFALFTFNFNTIAFSSENKIVIDGYDFLVLKNDINGVLLQSNDDNINYVFELNKNTSKINIESKETNLMKRSIEVKNFNLNLDEYTADEGIKGMELIDNDTGISYNIDSNKNSRLAFLIPIGIPLLYAALEALLAVGCAIIIAGVVYTLAEEIASELKKQNNYRYYAAILKSGSVWIGNGLSTAAAKAIAYSNDAYNGVMAMSYSYAFGLTGGNCTHIENHGSGSGWWDHIHANIGFERGKAHIWFY